MCRVLVLFLMLVLSAAGRAESSSEAPAASAFERFKALAGDWVDADGVLGKPGAVVANYRLTGGGSAVVETLMPGTAQEMSTVYHRDGKDMALTHYCAAGNQPRMRARSVRGEALDFEFDGGTHLDPARDMHMHSMRFEFQGPDAIRQTWQAWKNGAPTEHAPVFRLQRRPPA